MTFHIPTRPILEKAILDGPLVLVTVALNAIQNFQIDRGTINLGHPRISEGIGAVLFDFEAVFGRTF